MSIYLYLILENCQRKRWPSVAMRWWPTPKCATCSERRTWSDTGTTTGRKKNEWPRRIKGIVLTFSSEFLKPSTFLSPQVPPLRSSTLLNHTDFAVHVMKTMKENSMTDAHQGDGADCLWVSCVCFPPNPPHNHPLIGHRLVNPATVRF